MQKQTTYLIKLENVSILEKYYVTRIKECFKQKVRQVAVVVHKRRVQAIVTGSYCLVTQGSQVLTRCCIIKEDISINKPTHTE